MAINPQIFREYDIRGIVERDLSGDVAENIGRAFGSELRDSLRPREGAAALLGEHRLRDLLHPPAPPAPNPAPDPGPSR